ncbi:MAG: type II secretion system protein [Phycisphaeraceae bacterium]|nr:type II secretion system protein [Phycisphaeraceae bacterium]
MSSKGNRRSTPRSRPGAGFTLIELLAVISIIVILMAIAITTGVLVIGRQDAATTRGILNSLDRALEEYIVESGGTIPPFIDTAYRGVPGEYLVADSSSRKTNDLTDAGDNSTYLNRAYPRHPDAAVFIGQAAGIGAVDDIIAGIPDRFVVPTATYGTVYNPNDPNSINYADVTPSVVDAWGDTGLWAAKANDPLQNPWPILDDSARVIFYVHPNNRLAQDLYGKCVNNRPYFFSAGPDGLYGTTSQFTQTGAIDPGTVISVGGNGEDITTTSMAIKGLEDNLYSYPVDPALNTDEFNGTYR